MTYRGSLPSGQAYNGQPQIPPAVPQHYPYSNGQAQPYPGPSYVQPQAQHANYAPAPMNMHGHGQFATYPASFDQQQVPHSLPPTAFSPQSYPQTVQPAQVYPAYQHHAPVSQPIPQYMHYAEPMGATQSTHTPNTIQVAGGAPSRVRSSPDSIVVKSPAISVKSPGIAKKSPAVSSKSSPALSSKSKPFDTAPMLIHVAEECFGQAHSAIQNITTTMSEDQVWEYQKVIATGLACLEAALQSNKMSPRQEARTRLRYASILCEETENLQEAETALSKGITLCEKHRYADLKYCMQYLLLKVLFQRNQKAALIAVDSHISDCLTFKHVHWVYAFRLLKATFHVQAGSPSDAAILDNLRSISALANERGDHAISVFASLLEGLALLRTMKEDTIERVQTCLAQAAKFQLDPSVQIPQLDVLKLLLDLACSMHQKTPETLLHKLRILQNTLDASLTSSGWAVNDPEILLPLRKQPATAQTISDDTTAVLRAGSSDGPYDFVVMSFLTKVELYAMVYTFSGLAGLYKPGSNPKRSPDLWKEGLDVLDRWDKTMIGQKSVPAASLQESIRQAKWRKDIFFYLQILTGLYSATHSEWKKVNECIGKLQKAETPSVNETLRLLVLYLSGVYHQGTGDLETALYFFEDSRFHISENRGPSAGSKPAKLEICLLAALNRLWILQDPGFWDEKSATELLEKIRPLCADHQDRDIRTAFNLVQATSQTYPPPSMHQIKTSIQLALNSSKNTGNTHCLSIALNIMRCRLFENVVGEQALKSAKAASAQAKRSGNLLWMSVADGMLAHSHEVQGQFAEAQAARDMATEYASYAFTGKD